MKKQKESTTVKMMNLCCYDIKEALVDLYINVKVRNDTSMVDIDSERIDCEKEMLRELDNLVLVEYIKSSVEILVSLKQDNDELDQSSFVKKNKKNILSSFNGSIKSGMDVKFGGMGFSSQNSLESIPLNEGSQDPNSFSALPKGDKHLPRQYEQIIQKLEGDVRSHIRLEQQMRIHIENISNRVEELENQKEKQDNDVDYQISEIKREKRRLDDLLTIRENELGLIKKQEALSIKLIGEKDQTISDIERKLKHLEKKHDKVQTKMQGELQKYKKRLDSYQTQNVGQSEQLYIEPSLSDPLRISQGSKVSRKSSDKVQILSSGSSNSKNPLNEINPELLNSQNFSQHFSNGNSAQGILRQSNEFLKQTNQTQGSLNQQQQLLQHQILVQQHQSNQPKQSQPQQKNPFAVTQQQLSMTLGSSDMSRMRQDYKRHRNTKDISPDKANSSSMSQLHTQTSSSQGQQYKKSILKSSGSVLEYQAPQQQEAYIKALEEKNEEINTLKKKLSSIHGSQTSRPPQTLTAQSQESNKKRRTSSGRNQGQIHQSMGNNVKSSQNQALLSGSQKNLHQSNSNHKRSKTHINFYNPAIGTEENGTSKVNGPEMVSTFDPEKENFATDLRGHTKSVSFLARPQVMKEDSQTRVKDGIKRNNSTDSFQQQPLQSFKSTSNLMAVDAKGGAHMQNDSHSLVQPTKILDHREKKAMQNLFYQKKTVYPEAHQLQQMNSARQITGSSNSLTRNKSGENRLIHQYTQNISGQGVKKKRNVHQSSNNPSMLQSSQHNVYRGNDQFSGTQSLANLSASQNQPNNLVYTYSRPKAN